MDQLAVHKSKVIKPVYEKLDIMPIFNVGYSPELNGIEAVFSKVKRTYNKQRLNCLVNQIQFDPYKRIKGAFRGITKEHCAACIRKSSHILENYL